MESLSHEELSKVRSRSVMLKQLRVCNGEKSGFQCAHYFECIVPLDVDSADHLKQGEISRCCTLIVIKGEPLDFGEGGMEMPVKCNRYQASERPYEPESASYEPLTPEEIKALEDEQNGQLPPDMVTVVFDLADDLGVSQDEDTNT